MDSNLLVAVIITLVTVSSIYLWQSDRFNKAQKTLLLLCFVFPPLQWIMILIVIYYNKYKTENTPEIRDVKIYEALKTKLNSSINNLKDLKEKGLLTQKEFNSKVEKIQTEKTNTDLKNTTEFRQLQNLFNDGILTKDEFESKINILNSSYTKVINNKNTPSFSPSFEDYWSKNKGKFQKTIASIGLMLALLWIISFIIFAVQKYIN